MNTIEISISKRKLIFSFVGCLAFILAGCLFIFSPSSFEGKTAVRNEAMIMIVGVLSVLFFGLCGYFIAKKLFTKLPGLVIDEKGIADHSSGIEGGFVPWSDINSIGTTKVFRQQFVTVLLKDPQKYIEREKNVAKKKVMQANLRAVGTPYCISAGTLSISFGKLYRILKDEHGKRSEQ